MGLAPSIESLLDSKITPKMDCPFLISIATSSANFHTAMSLPTSCGGAHSTTTFGGVLMLAASVLHWANLGPAPKREASRRLHKWVDYAFLQCEKNTEESKKYWKPIDERGKVKWGLDDMMVALASLCRLESDNAALEIIQSPRYQKHYRLCPYPLTMMAVRLLDSGQLEARQEVRKMVAGWFADIPVDATVVRVFEYFWNVLKDKGHEEIACEIGIPRRVEGLKAIGCQGTYAIDVARQAASKGLSNYVRGSEDKITVQYPSW